MSDNLELRIKELIIKTLELKDIQPEDISDDQPLMDSDLGLDSIDALELVVQIEKSFGIKLENSEAAKTALKSVSSMAAMIRECQARAAAK
jgi:acyl carrier protein